MKFSAIIAVASAALVSAQAQWSGDAACGRVEGANAASHTIATEGIPYLRNLGGTNCHAPPRFCQRVSCSGGSGIFLCNDNNNDVNIRCETIGEGAARIFNACNGNSTPYFKGQQFAAGGWNVVVRASDC
ncbi:hypothetical protein Dda_7162 [Drechslerella dactyloides]|uniref:Uncharacterized protein n=1 Tax=Drechslerella dactyloides TaxID=74499 RepID=A0AAD6IT93_DREDA|nr:hypothetical protein Dda_7162 [Drechslerella dactyloides]